MAGSSHSCELIWIWGVRMKITSIVKQKFNNERYSIYIDDVFSFSASIEDVMKNSLVVDTILDEKSLEALIDECEYTKAFEYSLSLIERKDYTAFEIENKLKNKELSNPTIKRTIEKLEALGFVNDSKFSQRYLNDSLSIKKQGIKKITYELNKKGISKEDIALLEFDEDTLYKNALFLAEKKYKLINDKKKAREKLFRYLVSKGYDFEMVKKAINEVTKEEDSFDI